jgi:inosine-uridine nucleoside N-ribohydrolase
MVGLDATAMMQLSEERQKQLFAFGTPATDALAALTNLWGNRIPTLFDPMAVAYALGHRFADDQQQNVVVDDDGLTRITDGPRNVTILLNPQKEAFLDWYIAILARYFQPNGKDPFLADAMGGIIPSFSPGRRATGRKSRP